MCKYVDWQCFELKLCLGTSSESELCFDVFDCEINFIPRVFHLFLKKW